MKKMIKFSVAAVGFAVLLPLSGDLLAQSMGDGHGEGMSRMHAFSPHHLLMHGEHLNLTGDQRESLMRIQQDAVVAHDASQNDHAEKQGEFMGLFADGADIATVRELFDAAHAAGGEAHWAMINAAMESMSLLDEIQLARANGWADMMEMSGKMGEGHGGSNEEGEAEHGGGHRGAMRH